MVTVDDLTQTDLVSLMQNTQDVCLDYSNCRYEQFPSRCSLHAVGNNVCPLCFFDKRVQTYNPELSLMQAEKNLARTSPIRISDSSTADDTSDWDAQPMVEARHSVLPVKTEVPIKPRWSTSQVSADVTTQPVFLHLVVTQILDNKQTLIQSRSGCWLII